MDQQKKILPESIGLCVKDSNRHILFQNEKCIAVCGEMNGIVCTKTCMRRYLDGSEELEIPPGTHVELGILSDDDRGSAQLIDAVVINDTQTVTTIFSPVPEQTLKARDAVKNYKLSPSQQRVFDLVLGGKTNQQIANALFISIPTVRTHLTKIYEKIPNKILHLVLAGSPRLSIR